MILPNAEGIVIAALRGDERVSALCAGRVYADLPSVKTWPAVRVTRYGGSPAVGYPLVLDTADIQLDTWADTKQGAFDLANAARHACSALPGVHRLGTVTGAHIGALAYLPDDVFDPAKPRYVADVRLWVKPTATL